MLKIKVVCARANFALIAAAVVVHFMRLRVTVGRVLVVRLIPFVDAPPQRNELQHHVQRCGGGGE